MASDSSNLFDNFLLRLSQRPIIVSAQGSYGWFSMALIPSSTVKTFPHFAHFTFVSLEADPAQPRVKTAINATPRTKLVSFFIPLHLLSFIEKNSLWGGLNIQKGYLPREF
jgi:hypothetical protein